jgi:hypothetical protein
MNGQGLRKRGKDLEKIERYVQVCPYQIATRVASYIVFVIDSGYKVVLMLSTLQDRGLVSGVCIWGLDEGKIKTA